MFLHGSTPNKKFCTFYYKVPTKRGICPLLLDIYVRLSQHYLHILDNHGHSTVLVSEALQLLIVYAKFSGC